MTLNQLRKDSIQVLPDANRPDVELYSFVNRGPLLPAWGTRERERRLRSIYRHDYNYMVQGAFAGIMKRIASTPWEITGPDRISAPEMAYYRKAYKTRFASKAAARDDIEYWQAVLRQADFGRGWATFVEKGVDYLRQDSGWFWEIVAPGDVNRPPTGPATGIAHLDALRCYPTGDPEFPVIYWDKQGKKHIIHHTRVIQITDMPDGDETRPGYGLCALSRAISIAMREVLAGRYVESMLDDKPPPGIVITNLMRGEREKALERYQEDQNTDEQKPWGRQLWFHTPDAGMEPKLETTTFAQAPASFDFDVYTRVDVNALALAIGVDVQELWQLTAGSLGSGAQSEILAQKARGKTIGSLYTAIERSLNDILPEGYTFGFKWQDPAEAIEAAQKAQLWANAVAAMGSHITDDEARRILANQVEAVNDAIADENGQIRRVDDIEVGPDEDIGAAPDNQQTVEDATGSPQQAALQQRALDVERSGRWHADPIVSSDSKAMQATLLDFEADFADLLTGALKGEVTRARFGVVARALLRRYGQQAYKDGLNDSGVATDELSAEDRNALAVWLADQSGYVNDLGKRLYAGADNRDPDYTAGLWGAKSLREAYQLGVLSADRNGMYEWVLGATEQHCKDCLRLNGQRHRLKDWHERGWLPGVFDLECKGFNCDCKLQRTTEQARGRF